MSMTLDLVADLWAHIGPGLLFVVALPLFLFSLGLVVKAGYRQLRPSPDL